MSPKLLLCLALVVIGGLFVVRADKPFANSDNSAVSALPQMRAQTNQFAVKETKVKEAWNLATNTLYSLSGAATSVMGKENVYSFQLSVGTNYAMDLPIPTVVFVNKQTGNVWAGRKAEFYVEGDSGIVGIRLTVGGILMVEKSLLSKARPGEKLDDIVGRFEKQKNHSQLFRPIDQRIIGLKSKLSVWFFFSSPQSVQMGNAKIKHFTVHEGILQLDLESQTGVYTASVWIDLKTWKVVKAVQDGNS